VEKALMQIMFGLTVGIGPALRRDLLVAFGSLEALWHSSPSERLQVKGYNPKAEAAWQQRGQYQAQAASELAWMKGHQINTMFWGQPDYPTCLSHCSDPPTLLYYRGKKISPDARFISIVGTRNNSHYGKRETEKLVAALPKNAVVVSGLATGIDQIAHQAALEAGLDTIAVLAHGLEKIYPTVHRPLAIQIMQQGALWTENHSFNKMGAFSFPRRNRIVAGMSPVTVVIESDTEGGSMITANDAFGYGHSVYALPGRVYDSKSKGTNDLIQINRAQLYTSPEWLMTELGWNKGATTNGTLFSGAEMETGGRSALADKIFLTLLQNEKMHIDQLLHQSQLTHAQLAGALLELELMGCLQAMPGQWYALQQA
jgi:DNA processing protein